MDELSKTEARNYLSAAGFFVLGLIYLLIIFGDHTSHLPQTACLGIGFSLLIIGILLLVLRKRDMIAILFIMLSAINITNGFISGFLGEILLLGFNVMLFLTILITLTGKDKAKWVLIIIPLLMVITSLIETFGGARPEISPAVFTIFAVSAVVCMYFAFCCASERIHLPGRKILTADEQTDFKASGSVLGYMLFASTSGMYVLYYFFGDPLILLEYTHIIDVVASFLMVIIAILLFTVGKMRFTPVMFMILALTEFLGLSLSGSLFIGLAIGLIILGLFAMLRKESRILPGIMIIIYAGTFLFSVYAGATMPMVSAVLNAIPCLIAIYLAFVVYSQKKLPKF